MKRVFAVLGAVFALMLFSTSFAFAQTEQSWNVYRKAWQPANKVVANMLAQAGVATDPIEIEEVEENPLDIPGIKVLKPGKYYLDLYSNENAYLKPGVHWLINEEGDGAYGANDISDGAKVFFAPGAILYISPGNALGFGGGWDNPIQLLGPGPGNGTRIVFAGSGFRGTEMIFAGHDIGIEVQNKTNGMETDFGQPISYDAIVYGVYITNNGVGIMAIDSAATDMELGTIEFHRSALWNNIQNMDVDLTAAKLRMIISSTSFTAPGNDLPFSIRNGSGEYTANFEDCVFSRNPWEVPSFVENQNNGSIVFSETRPLTGLVQTWPRDVLISPADFTANGAVGTEDVNLLSQAFGDSSESIQFGSLYDLDESGLVDMPDMLELAYAFAGLERSEPITTLAASPRMPAFMAEVVKYPAVVEAAKADLVFGPIIQAYLYPTAVAEVGGEVPSEFALSQNYPNPFNSSTQIRFSVAEPGFVELKVYDMLGRAVYTLVSEHLEPGVWTQNWDGLGVDGRPVASGTYFYRMSAGEYTQTNKMLLLR